MAGLPPQNARLNLLAFDTAPWTQFANVNGRATLASQLYSPTNQLQVSSRRRIVFPNLNVGPIAAGAVANGSTTSNNLDVLNVGDGFLFEFFQCVASGASLAGGQLVTILGIGISITWQGGFGVTLLPTNMTTTTLAPFASGGGASIVLAVTPNLWTSWDLWAISTAGHPGQPLPRAAQPATLALNLSVFNGAAAANTVSLNTPSLFYRTINGLEEG